MLILDDLTTREELMIEVKRLRQMLDAECKMCAELQKRLAAKQDGPIGLSERVLA